MSLIYTFSVLIISDGNHNYDCSCLFSVMTSVTYLEKAMNFHAELLCISHFAIMAQTPPKEKPNAVIHL